MNRTLKRTLLRTCNPVDYVVRRINGLQSLPPLHLRWDVGPLSGFESSGAEYRVFLKEFARLLPASRIFDIGCGCGQIALKIAGSIDRNGSYTACDINREAVDWCRSNISTRLPNFSFFHMDVRSRLYNPGGTVAASEYRFSLNPAAFDIILLKSVFTHMLREEVFNYLSQLRPLLKESGRVLVSFFLMNERQRLLKESGGNIITFHPYENGLYVSNPDLPEAIVAYEEADVLQMIRDAGLKLARPVEHGQWTGDRSGLTHQDLIVLEPAG